MAMNTNTEMQNTGSFVATKCTVPDNAPNALNPIIISIEGNIGSGKSTFMNVLVTKYKDRSDVLFLDEPVSVWNTVTDSSGVTILEHYYADPHKYAFSFQMMAYISRISVLLKTIKMRKHSIIITERSVFTDLNIFAKMLYDDKKINEIEYRIYMQWFDEFTADLPKVNIIYMRTSPQTANDRVIKRGRLGETIPLEYLANCHEYHEKWLMSENTNEVLNNVYFESKTSNINNIMCIDANEEVSDCKEKWFKRASLFIETAHNIF